MGETHRREHGCEPSQRHGAHRLTASRLTLLQTAEMMTRRNTLVAAWVLFVVVAVHAVAADYFPPRGEWAKKPPADLGFDAAKLAAAIEFAVANENASSKDVAEELKATFGKREPNFKIVGPTQPRAALNGLVVHRGYVAAEWGRRF